jgi:hypothetical protein
MVFGFFGKQDLVDEEAGRWLFDTFAWCLSNFDAEVFYRETQLVVPSNEYFPGRETSIDGMARLIFDHVTRYAGMQHWPFQLVDQAVCSIAPPAAVRIQGALRGSKGVAQGESDEASRLAVVYDADLLGNPEALIAGYAHAMAHYLGQTARRPPPGGTAYWPQATEVLAVFMGFGLMFANSAFSVPVRSCGSCGSPPAQRRSYLTQYESTYALAIFSVLKGLANKAVLGHLKKALRPFFRQCVKEIQGKPEELERLKSLSPRPTPETAGAMAEFS